MKKIAIYPGSFDPLTLGHIDILTRAMKLVSKMIIAIGVNPDKKPLFSTEERIDFIKKDITPLAQKAGIELEICYFEGLLMDLAREKEASFILRGLRNGDDYDYEFSMAATNQRINAGVETIFLLPSPERKFLSSHLVRQVAIMGGDVRAFVPEKTYESIEKRFKIK
ncbi:MAG: pantetheine-phosphate adenylyltransferase [Parvibaculales bacterium]